MNVTGTMTVLVKAASADKMAVYPQTAYNPKIHRPWLEKMPDCPSYCGWWRIRSVNYCVGGWNPGESSYADIAYSKSPEELILWADLNGVPVAKTQEI